MIFNSYHYSCSTIIINDTMYIYDACHDYDNDDDNDDDDDDVIVTVLLLMVIVVLSLVLSL